MFRNKQMAKTLAPGRGFTLVEMLIVAVILAILAVVVIPRFGESTEAVRLSVLKATLHTVRTQLQLYHLQHNTTYPALLRFEAQMTNKTDADGSVSSSGAFGPYILEMPVNPMDNLSTLSDFQNGNGGWMYNQNTGVFKSNDPGVTNPGSDTKDL